MVIIDTSAWIEYFRASDPHLVETVDECFDNDFVGIGDLIYCEVIQGIRKVKDRNNVSKLLLSLPQFDLAGFQMAEKAAANYRLLRSKGVTVRKTIDVIIGTFCIEHSFTLLHFDRDFEPMEKYLGLKTLSCHK